jgi:hypothetical protein
VFLFFFLPLSSFFLAGCKLIFILLNTWKTLDHERYPKNQEVENSLFSRSLFCLD